ncbi:arylsulfotransferase ASST [Prosthecobacter fusiformis]|uniref:Arylsulfotransferase ASST n=1 Tax=Prosthecobacter fusiformis TaxID=48464 RepID=A0A4R7S6C7_9BACT|nr:aryl-sulfate sulfotransferase [Prosthecobacter fusiformis]TDU73449.1 arylsulfotransferase ASST [Prosthecobacter fusiformis]
MIKFRELKELSPSKAKHCLEWFCYLFAAASLLLAPCIVVAEHPHTEGAFLVTPVVSPATYLIRFPDEILHVWPSPLKPSGPGRVNENGELLRVVRDHLPPSFRLGGGTGGRITKTSWDGKEVWSYTMATPTLLIHHDALQLPNGNVLALVWQRHSPEEATAKGRDPNKVGKAGIWSDSIWELQPLQPRGAHVVWEWNAWDHIQTVFSSDETRDTQSQNPDEYIDIKGGWDKRPAWAGVTRMEYSDSLDQVLLVAKGFGAIWIIDHGTTTTEAASGTGGKAGKGGRLLYQWSGSPPDHDAQATSFIIDAEWSKGIGSKDASIEVLRGTCRNGSVSYTVEEWQLPRLTGGSGYLLTTAGRYESPSLLNSRPLTMPELSHHELSRPTALSNGVVTFGAAGVIRSLNPAGMSLMEYKNGKGVTSTRISKTPVDPSLCCGGSQTGKEDSFSVPTQETFELKTAPVMKSRRVNLQKSLLNHEKLQLDTTGKTLQPIQ